MYTMKLKFPMTLSAAVLLAAAGFSYSAPEAWGHGSFSMPSSPSMHFAPRTFQGNSFQRFHNHNGNIKNFKAGKGKSFSQTKKVKSLSGIKNNALITKQGGKQYFKKLSQNQ